MNKRKETVAADYWDRGLTWSGRIKILRRLDLTHGLFKTDFQKLPELVQRHLIWELNKELGEQNEE